MTFFLKGVIIHTRVEEVGNRRTELTSRVSKTETDKDNSPHGRSFVRYTNVNQNLERLLKVRGLGGVKSLKNFFKKVLTNHSKRVIMIIEKEREVMIMRIDVAMTCPLCGEDHSVKVNLAQYEAWQNGKLIQNAMPDLTPVEREQLISGLCPKCQAKIFGE